MHFDGKNTISHFEMYVEAMKEIGANTKIVTNFMKKIQNGGDVKNKSYHLTSQSRSKYSWPTL